MSPPINGVEGLVPAPTSADAAAGDYLRADGTWAVPAGTGGSPAFSGIQSGTNATAAMDVGSGASLFYTGTGVVNANEVGGINAAGNTPSHEGQLLISQPGNTTAVWADPLVQGISVAGTVVSGINPVLIGVADPSGNLRNLNEDAAGNLKTVVENTVTVAPVTSPPTPWVVDGNLTHNTAAPSSNNVGVLPALSNQIAPVYVEGNQVLLSTDLTGAVRTTVAATSVLQDLITTHRRNQFDINFSSSDFTNAAAITNAATGGGSYTQATGMGIYSAGSSVSTAGDASGITVSTLVYRPGFDIYAYFTAAFVAPTDSSAADNFIRIGLYDATDGVYIGFEGNVFSASVRKNSADSHTAQTVFNTDKLNGLAGSRFTRGGVIEAPIWTNLNLFRIRFSWFGAAPILFDIYTPDGVWIPFQRISQPNTSATPSLYSINLPFTGEAFKSAASTSGNVQFASGCWAVGTTADGIRVSDTLDDLDDAILTRSVITGKTPAGSYGNVGTSAENALSISGSGATSSDAATWASSNPGPQTPIDTALVMVNNSLNYNSVAVELEGSGTISTGKLVFEVSIEGSNWTGLVGHNVTANSTMASSTFSLTPQTTALTFNIAGFNYFRARLNPAITGAGGQVIISYNKQALSSSDVNVTTGTVNVSSNQGTAAALAGAWPMEITDGTNGPVTVTGEGSPPTAGLNVHVQNASAILVSLNAETTKVIGTVRNIGNAGAAFDAATGAAVPANAIQIGGPAKTALPVAVSDGQLVAPLADKFGRQAVVLNTIRDLVGTFSVQSTSASPTTLIGAGGAGVYNDITELVLTNESATATIVDISDGTTNFKFAIAGNGGLTKSFANPLVQVSSAAAWTISNTSTTSPPTSATIDAVGCYAKNK